MNQINNKFDSGSINGNAAEERECNDLELKALEEETGGRLNLIKHKPSSSAEDFRQALLAKILAKRQGTFTMNRFVEFFRLALQPKRLAPAAALLVILSIILSTSYLWLPQKLGPGESKFAAFSKLMIKAANADDNFELTPVSADSLGAEADTSYVLKSKEPVDEKLIRNNLQLEPEFSYDLEKISDTEWKIAPKEPLPPNTIVRIELKAAYTDEQSGQLNERDFSWAFQIKDSFKILTTIPRHKGVSVPTNSGIEITFSHDNFYDVAKYFSIAPEAPGRFEQHGRTMVFVPTPALKLGTLYTITVKKGLPLKESKETLVNDFTFAFETGGTESSRSYDRWLYVYDKFIETSAKQAPVITLSAKGTPDVEVDIYRFRDLEEYMNSVKLRDQLPWWSYSKDDFLEKTDKLIKFSSFKQTVKQTGRAQYLEFPQKLEPGFYLAEIKGEEDKRVQVWLQVSNLAAYYNVTKTKTLVWVNDISSKAPAANVLIELYGSAAKYATNQDGIAEFTTPEMLKIKDQAEGSDQVYYFKISRGQDILIMPATRNSRSYGDWYNVNDRDDYWQYLYTDRPLYQTTDTIKYWGLLKKRDSANIAEPVSLTLYKEGYVDYYYQPISIVKQDISLSDLDTYGGEIKLNNLRPDYYTLQIKVGDQVIKTKYIEIRSYTKPAYQLSLIPDRKKAFAGEPINLKVKASFFEGTPVPNLDLVFKMPDRPDYNFTTNDRGEADLTYSQDYYDCRSDYSCWPDYAWLTVTPRDSELAEITAEANVQFYGPAIYLENEVKYPKPGQAQINIVSRFIDFNKSEEDYWRRNSLGDKPAPGIKLEGEVIKITYSRQETGTEYDFISKRSYKTYNYVRHEDKIDNFSVAADQAGKYTYTRTIEPETAYRVIIKAYDKDGRYDVYNEYLYYYNGLSVYYYGGSGYPYYHLKLPEDKKYKVGEEVAAQFLNNDDPMPAGKKKFLYLQLANGLKEYALGDSSDYRFKFTAEDIPNVNLAGVYFNGTTYVTSQSYYYGRSVSYDTESSLLKIKTKTDKEKYLPGQEVALSLSVTDTKDQPKQAEVNLNLIDEAFYAVMEDSADPLGEIYSYISPGSLLAKSSHFTTTPYGGAEMGGCFAAGTKISMADGSVKAIEDVKTGDKVMTLADPRSVKQVEGTVAQVFQHTVAEYLIINDELKVTPEHLVFANDRFNEAGRLKVGDWLLKQNGQKVNIFSIKLEHKIIPVYNFRVEPQHTYIAGGFYVHNEKGGGPREYFVDAALFKAIRTDSAGQASLKFKLPDNITSWRVTAQAITGDLDSGVAVAKIPVSLPVFQEVSVGSEYLKDDKPTARLRAFGVNLTKNDQVSFNISAPSLGLAKSEDLKAAAFTPAYFDLPALQPGRHDIIYNLATAKGNDAVKLPLAVINSRLEAQAAVNSKLTTDFQVKAINDRPMAVVLSDLGQNQLYEPLIDLSWNWGDRLDQRLAQKQAKLLLRDYYQEKIIEPSFSAFNYQLKSGGLSLLPYSSEDLALSAKAAAVSAADFDQESLKQYLFDKLEDRASNREEISLALFGLAALKEPVLPRINQWLKRGDLTVQDKIYLALAMSDLGAKEEALKLYYEILLKSAQTKEPQIMIKVSEKDDDNFQATAAMSVLAASLNREEAPGLLDYLTANQVFYGKNKNSENLYDLEKINYIKEVLPNLKPGPAKVVYELSGRKVEANITGGNIHAFQLEPVQADQLKFLSIEGEAGISVRYTKPLDPATAATDPELNIRREYYVNGVKTNVFNEQDVVEVRLFPEFGAKALSGTYQITDILPSGLIPVAKLYSRDIRYDCHYWYPYNRDGQLVKYRIDRNWRDSYCGGSYISYYARVKTTGQYKAEPAIIQSFLNPAYINYSNGGTVVINKK